MTGSYGPVTGKKSGLRQFRQTGLKRVHDSWSIKRSAVCRQSVRRVNSVSGRAVRSRGRHQNLRLPLSTLFIENARLTAGKAAFFR